MGERDNPNLIPCEESDIAFAILNTDESLLTERIPRLTHHLEDEELDLVNHMVVVGKKMLLEDAKRRAEAEQKSKKGKP